MRMTGSVSGCISTSHKVFLSAFSGPKMPKDLPLSGLSWTTGVGGGAEMSVEGVFSRGDDFAMADSTSASPSSIALSALIVAPRALLTVDFLRTLRSTRSVSLLKLTTRCDTSRKIELARAIGDGETEGERERERDLSLVDDTLSLLIPLEELSLRDTPTPVFKDGRSSPRRVLLPRSGILEDGPSTQETLALFRCLSCLCPLFVLLADRDPAAGRPVSVNGVVSVSGGEKGWSASSSFADVCVIVGRREPDGGVLGRRPDKAEEPRERPTDAAAKPPTSSRGVISPELGRSSQACWWRAGLSPSRVGESSSCIRA